MLIDIPAVASMEGAVASLTYQPTGVYEPASGLIQLIYGDVVSGTITPGEDLVQQVTGYTVTHSGTVANQYITTSLLIAGTVANSKYDYIGQTSAAVFTPLGQPHFSPRCFIHVTPNFGAPYILTTQDYSWDGFILRITKRISPGSTLKVLTAAAATFTVPQWCRSFTLKNISAAAAFVRRYAPNVEANVIDTDAVTFGEDGIVGQEIAVDQVFSYSHGDFTPGCSFAMCATASAANGAIVSFNP